MDNNLLATPFVKIAPPPLISTCAELRTIFLRKYELSIMIASGICSKGVCRPILVENTVNEFAYAQALLFYKENFDKLKIILVFIF